MNERGKITRFEVIDARSGRLIVLHGVHGEYEFQDGGQTLKVFVGADDEVEVSSPLNLKVYKR